MSYYSTVKICRKLQTNLWSDSHGIVVYFCVQPKTSIEELLIELEYQNQMKGFESHNWFECTKMPTVTTISKMRTRTNLMYLRRSLCKEFILLGLDIISPENSALA